MVNVYIAVSDKQRQLTIDGSLELFGQLLAAVQQVAPPEGRLARAHLERAAHADARTVGHAHAEEARP